MSAEPIENTDERIVILNDVEESEISDVIKTLFSLAQKNTNPIFLILNTFGGSVYDMFALYDAIKYVQHFGIEVNTIGLGKIMSAGVILLSSGTKRKIGKNATIMVHQLSDDFISGKIFAVNKEFEEMRRLQEKYTRILCENTRISKEKFDELIETGGDIYFSSEFAIENGIVDEYLESLTSNIIPKKRLSKNKQT